MDRHGNHFIDMEKPLPILALFFVCGLSAQVDSCEEVRLKWAITAGTGEPAYYEAPDKTVYHLPDIGKTIPYDHFPDTKKMVPQTKIQLWANTQVFRFKGYQVNNEKVFGWCALSLAGAVDGICEGYEFDGRTSFQRKYGVSATGAFGSRSWANKDANRFYKYTGVPDFYHVADDLRKFGYISGGMIVGISGGQLRQKWWHYAVDLGLSFIVSGTCKAAGMYWIRN